MTKTADQIAAERYPPQQLLAGYDSNARPRAAFAAGWREHERESANVEVCEHCHGSRIEFVAGGHGNVLEVPCSYCCAQAEAEAEAEEAEEELVGVMAKAIETQATGYMGGETSRRMARAALAAAITRARFGRTP